MSVGDATSARRLEVGGIGLNVLDDGEGPAVLLLHGFPDSLDLWRHQVPALTGSGFRVVGHDWGAALALRRDDWRFFREAFGGGGDLDRYIEDLSRPGRLTAGLNWYRA
nr:hypothetical protein [Thermoleophilaceae bacterium]